MAKSPKKPKVIALVFEKLDMAACRLARHEENAETVDRYQAVLENEGTLPPIDAHGWPKCDRYYVSDGGHRISGAMMAKYKSIQAHVTMHADQDAAWAAAMAAAATGNAHHGLPRSDADLRALVGHVLQMPSMKEASDRAAADYCACSRAMIKKVRIALTENGTLKGKAAARYTATPDPSGVKTGDNEAIWFSPACVQKQQPGSIFRKEMALC